MKIRLCLLLCAAMFELSAQDAADESRFPTVTPVMLGALYYPIDSGATAVVLAEYSETKVNGSNDGGFEFETRIRRRIHLLKKASFDRGTVVVDLFTNEEEQEKVSKLNAVTWVLEGGKVTETKLNTKSDVYTEKLNRNHIRKKFTLPGLKEGAIIEYEYTLTSGYLFNLRPWYFQGEVPCLWSEYRVAFPEFLNYIMLQQGILPFTIADTELKPGTYNLTFMRDVYAGKTVDERLMINCRIAHHRWVISNVPAFKEEAYTSSPDNYMNRIWFQLSGFQQPLVEKTLQATWPEFTASVLNRLDFVNEMENTGEWWPEEMKQVLKGATSESDIAKAIYSYVSTRFSLNSDESVRRNPLKKVAAAKSGNMLELNLLLVAMLRYAGLQADPVMLSTREHGYSTEAFPITGQFNYLVCRVKADEDDWLLDATHPYLGFGKLPYQCYNGQARVLNREATLIHLLPDQLTESDEMSVDINFNMADSPQWKSTVNHRYGFFASEELREKIKKAGLESFRKELALDEIAGESVSDLTVESLEKFGTSLQVTYKTETGVKADNELYLKPVLVPYFRQNPLKSAERKYPVEMPYKISQQYTVHIRVPEGYEVEELPASFSADINGKKDAAFDYTVTTANGKVTIQYGLDITKTYFKPDEYRGLREFFSKIAAKLEEQIVFKKK
ncbi:MAG TPA: DUF3858 domain-containing protein [Chitinophagaceae bacterium]|nr:DUF3858 domain-containing protein [Chitinophagaceae bacterium]HPH32261.1 DUF3858 domain-containing protein [Chitinophagaceae bacterium]HPN58906.1 DUF3858 domain-containing protein [Chitinophagaceae bacterium]